MRDDKPFDIISNIDGLFAILSLLNSKDHIEFKVYFGGAPVKPEHFGWGALSGWVDRFEHEEVIENARIDARIDDLLKGEWT